MKNSKKIEYADDDFESVSTLLRLRAPALFLGLVLGVLISFATSRFEEVLSQNIQIAFFLPFVVYMSAAVGSQTEAIYSRDLKSGNAKFHNYLVKETALGIILGAAFGIISGAFVMLWLKDLSVAMSVGLSMFASTAIAPIIGLVVTQVLQNLHDDPAAGSGPIGTVIQDMISVIIYGVICSMILL